MKFIKSFQFPTLQPSPEDSHIWNSVLSSSEVHTLSGLLGSLCVWRLIGWTGKSHKCSSVFTHLVYVAASGRGTWLEVWVSHRHSCCFWGWRPWESFWASEGGDFLTSEHCDPFAVQRTLMKQHFELFVCLCFLKGWAFTSKAPFRYFSQQFSKCRIHWTNLYRASSYVNSEVYDTDLSTTFTDTIWCHLPTRDLKPTCPQCNWQLNFTIPQNRYSLLQFTNEESETQRRNITSPKGYTASKWIPFDSALL